MDFFDKMDEATNALEEAVFQLDIIKSFEQRGWALYHCIFDVINELSELKPIIENGREKEKLIYSERYIPLPLIKDDDNFMKVYEKAQLCLMYGRSCYFVDMTTNIDYEKNEKYIEPTAVFLIDSVILEPPHLLLVVDPRLSKIRYPEMYKFEDGKDYHIVIHLADLWKIRKQLMKSLRGNEKDIFEDAEVIKN